MIYTRLYTDEHGESHFEDVGIELTLTDMCHTRATALALFFYAGEAIWFHERAGRLDESLASYFGAQYLLCSFRRFGGHRRRRRDAPVSGRHCSAGGRHNGQRTPIAGCQQERFAGRYGAVAGSVVMGD